MSVAWIRKTHRLLGLVVGIQLLLWSASGIYFSWNPIHKVRGEHLSDEPAPMPPPTADLIAPVDAVSAVGERAGDVESVTLRAMLGQPVYEVRGVADGEARFALVDALGGGLLSPIGRQTAEALARADFSPDSPVESVELVEAADADAEFRGRDLPVYRVTFDHPTGTRVYVSASRGLVTARRNDTWRTFDFLWMFHIMDYEARDDINNMVLRVLSVMGLVTVLSGYVLWVMTSRTMRRAWRRSPTARATTTRTNPP